MIDNKSIKLTLTLVLSLTFLIAIIIATQPPLLKTLLAYFIFLIIVYFIYKDKSYQSELVGISNKNLFRSIFWSFIFGIGFYLMTKFIPGFSIGLPLVPASVSDQLQFVIIVLLAPFVEELFFRGALLGYLRKTLKKRESLAIFIQAILFALAHLGAYVSGIYNYPDFISTLVSINANFAAFGAAFFFGLFAGWFVLRDGIKNLWFTILFHAIINFIIYTKLVVIFA